MKLPVQKKQIVVLSCHVLVRWVCREKGRFWSHLGLQFLRPISNSAFAFCAGTGLEDLFLQRFISRILPPQTHLAGSASRVARKEGLSSHTSLCNSDGKTPTRCTAYMRLFIATTHKLAGCDSNPFSTYTHDRKLIPSCLPSGLADARQWHRGCHSHCSWMPTRCVPLDLFLGQRRQLV